MKIKRTYLSGCTWCNALGFIPNPNMGWITDTTIICPVCNGAKTILVTEEYDALYEIDCSKVDVLTPIIKDETK
jgi:hypothetical protein